MCLVKLASTLMLCDSHSLLGLLHSQRDRRLHVLRVCRLPMVHLRLGHVTPRFKPGVLVDKITITGVFFSHRVMLVILHNVLQLSIMMIAVNITLMVLPTLLLRWSIQ